MLPKKLVDQVKRLDDEDKVHLFWMLRDDPALAAIAPEVTGLRYNFEAARVLQELLKETEAEGSLDT